MCGAKRVYYVIVKKTDGSTGGGSNDSIFGERDNNSNPDEEESEDGGEGGGVGGKGDDFDNSGGEDDTGTTAHGGGGRTSLGVDPTKLFGEVVAGVEGMNGSFVDVDRADKSVGVAATASTASSSHITTSSSGGKRLTGASMRGGQKKKNKAFTQPLRILRKSPSNDSDEGEYGYSFGNMMCMMMMQNCMDNEWREQQHKSDSEQREWEYQLRWEEMAIVREEARDQRQMMNLMSCRC